MVLDGSIVFVAFFGHPMEVGAACAAAGAAGLHLAGVKNVRWRWKMMMNGGNITSRRES